MSEVNCHGVTAAPMSFSDAHYRKEIHEFGAFDEESCRSYVREAGMRAVGAYSFTSGMEEIYCLMLEQCGLDGLPDAMSVIQDMMEGDGVADGLGDDGDIFRSWRHSWRQRNANSKNPFITRIGTFILPTPTQRHIRRLRAQNFIRILERPSFMEGNRTPLAQISGNRGILTASVTGRFDVSKILDDDDHVLPKITLAHQRCRILFASDGNEAAARIVGRSRLSFAGTSSSTTGYPWPELVDLSDSQAMSEIDTILFHPYDCLIEGESSTTPEKKPALRDRRSELYEEENDLDSEAAFVDENKQRLPVTVDDVVSQDLEMLPATAYQGASAWKGKMKASEPVDLESFDSGGSKSAEELSQTKDVKPHARLRRESQEPTKLQRAKNREARMIDGNMILPDHHANEEVSPEEEQPLSPNEIRVKVDLTVEVETDEQQQMASSRSWSPFEHEKDSPRRSWIASIRTTLRPNGAAKSSSDETSPPQSSKGTSKSFIWSDNGESQNGTPSPLSLGP
ncbi:hypothetical protein H2204_005921 [Knufia peltigerae]|uniref:Uncharacterized protein n=1 Tax=Knufia peltigerae TaxID=1002370 RepID=A0AA38Y4F4_9EURO|nr:hypothetical protein H2204_005921 [Knufia peltigerae]